jgi:predicted Ser/Thr protein kinase
VTDQEFKNACGRKYLEYMDNVWAFITRTRIKNPFTGKDEPPNEDLMRKVEEQVGIGEPMVYDFRQTMVVKSARPKPRYKLDDPQCHELEQAIAAVVTSEMDPASAFDLNLEGEQT